MPELEVDNQLDVEEKQDPAGQGGNGSGSGDNDADFLVVNDRTRFKTAEDAIKSYQEAGETIARLSGWEKEIAQRYGVTDPREAAKLFDELIQHRKDKEQRDREAQAAAAKKTETLDEHGEPLKKEELEARKWLKSVLPNLGYVPKDELMKTVEELKAAINELQGGSQENENSVFQGKVEEGRDYVAQQMKTDKIAGADEDELADKQLVIESLIRDWVNANQELINRFRSSSAGARAVIKEGYELAVKRLGWKKPSGDGTAVAQTALNRGRQMARNKSRPKTQGEGGGNGNEQPRKDAAGRTDFIGSVHDKAWEVANKHFHANAE